MSDKYFGAVIDLENHYGTEREISKNRFRTIKERYFNNKFVDTPEKALAVACDVLNKRNHGKMSMREIMNNVTYNSDTNEYVITLLLTNNWHKPTLKQMERYNNNESGFRFNLNTYRIQIYETTIITENLIEKAANLTFPIKKK